MQFGVKIRPHPPVLVKINGEAIVINFSTLLLAAFLQAKQHSSCNIYTDVYYNVLGERCELFFPSYAGVNSGRLQENKAQLLVFHR